MSKKNKVEEQKCKYAALELIIIALVVGAGLLYGGSLLYDYLITPEVNQCFIHKHDETTTARVTNVENSGLIEYTVLVQSNFNSKAPIHKQERYRPLRDFRSHYEKSDCALHIYKAMLYNEQQEKK